MAGGLAALLDDVAMIAKMASSAGSKAMAVVVDDSAVTPRYVQGVSPARELPMIWRIARGSLRNKLVFILPVALLLSHFAPWLLTPILMLGGLYLSFEGAEKIVEYVTGKHRTKTEQGEPVVDAGPELEDKMVRGAITTDFILSAEIMVISLNQIANADFWPRAFALVLVAIVITALVYGVVALIVKMDDVGLRLAAGEGRGSRALGNALVRAMPRVLTALSVIGVVAMLWVGGHILVVGAQTLGWAAPHDLIAYLAGLVQGVAAAGGALSWLVDTICSAVVGFAVGLVVVVSMHVLPIRGRHDVHEPAGPPADEQPTNSQ